MKRILTATTVAFLSISPFFAGALVLQIDNPRSSPEAAAKNAVVLARVTECMSPEKTVVAATAEGIVHGMRQSIPLSLDPALDSRNGGAPGSASGSVCPGNNWTPSWSGVGQTIVTQWPAFLWLPDKRGRRKTIVRATMCPVISWTLH